MLIKKQLKIGLTLLCTMLLCACATPQLNFRVQASDTLNADENGNTYAVLLRVYQLSDTDLFEQAAYEDLWKADTQVLASSLVSVHEFTIEPSLSKTIEVEKEEGARYAGIVAFFRSHEGNWKAYRKINHGLIPASTRMALTVSGSDIDLQYR